METSLEVELGTPRIEDKREMRIAGLRGTFTPETMPAIVELRQRFGPRIGTIPGETGNAAFGLGINVCSGEPKFEYMAGVEVTDISGLPDDLSSIAITAQQYAIFPTVSISPELATPST